MLCVLYECGWVSLEKTRSCIVFVDLSKTDNRVPRELWHCMKGVTEK